jgi:hypothetical protein
MNYRENFEKWLSSSVLTEEERAELSSLSEKEIEDRFTEISPLARVAFAA